MCPKKKNTPKATCFFFVGRQNSSLLFFFLPGGLLLLSCSPFTHWGGGCTVLRRFFFFHTRGYLKNMAYGRTWVTVSHVFVDVRKTHEARQLSHDTGFVDFVWNLIKEFFNTTMRIVFHDDDHENVHSDMRQVISIANTGIPTLHSLLIKHYIYHTGCSTTMGMVLECSLKHYIYILAAVRPQYE